MSCVLRISAPEQAASGLVPYRVENGIAHVQVSEAGFGDLRAQVADAVAFLRSNKEQLRRAMGHPAASGVLDFAVEVRDALVQSNRFTPELVREAGRLGLALELSHYSRAEA
jgi:hypothetical protein